MALEEDWGNLGVVAVPFLVSLGLAVGLALALRRAARQSGLPRKRDPCVNCVHERNLLRLGRCEQDCAVNELPALPLMIFVACATFVFLAAIFPSTAETFVVPLTPAQPGTSEVLVLTLLFCAACGAVAIAAYFLQDLARHREHLLWGAAALILAGVVVGTLSAGTVADVANGLAAAGLGLFLVGLALEWRARQGRPTVGLRAVGAAVVPLFVIAILALIRIVQILQLAAQS